ncbi:MAG: hypothetical protein EOO24_11965 [Comamonadaceae bacterium]|nr:MAG: hypothetical protein EOO24_11965 [Comamonadaceae bacterium]
MPSAIEGASASPTFAPRAVSADIPAGTALQLAQASRALWAATLSLMTAFMQTPAPAHRYLLARRISRNFATLSTQECFDGSSRASFGRLALRWEAKSAQFAPETPVPARGRGLLRFLF